MRVSNQILEVSSRSIGRIEMRLNKWKKRRITTVENPTASRADHEKCPHSGSVPDMPHCVQAHDPWEASIDRASEVRAWCLFQLDILATPQEKGRKDLQE